MMVVEITGTHAGLLMFCLMFACIARIVCWMFVTRINLRLAHHQEKRVMCALGVLSVCACACDVFWPGQELKWNSYVARTRAISTRACARNQFEGNI